MSHKAKTGLPKPGTIIPLSEGSFTIDKTKLFVPFNPEEDDLQQRPVGSLLVEVQPFLVVTSKDVLVLDAGLGFQENGTDTMQLHANLARAGIASVVGGAIGNLIDRATAGYVLDFVDAYWNNWHFWAFNVADAAITIGVGCMILDILGVGRRASNPV